MTLKTHAGNLFLFSQGDDVQTYLQRWLTQNWQRMDAFINPSTGTLVAQDKELRAYVQHIMAVLDPGGAPPPPP
jgi:uncharacterized protein YfaT (DUF1175 family)